MILFRWAGPRVLGGMLAAFALIGGLVGLATSVEHGGGGLWVAMVEGLRVIPIALVWLAPLCCGVGSAVVMAGIVARGEDVALASSGLGPLRTSWVAAVVGLAMGLCSWATADRVLPAVADSEDPSAWLWLEEGAYRAQDGLLVRTSEGRITTVERNHAPSAEALEYARQRAWPRTASSHVLWSTDTAPARVERHSRLARILACGAMALLGWAPVVRRSAAHVSMVLVLGLSSSAMDLGLQALARGGQVSTLVGAWAVPLLLAGMAWLSVRR